MCVCVCVYTQMLDTAGQQILEQRIRAVGVPWSAWASVPTVSGAGNNIVSVSGWVLLSNVGMHTVTVQYATSTQPPSR